MKKLSIQPNPEELTLRKAFNNFIQTKKLMGLAPESIKQYEGVFKYFTNYVGEDILCQDIKHDTVLGYIQYAKDLNPNISNVTINCYLRHIRAMLYYFMENGYMNGFKIRLVKCEKPLKEIYTDYEIEKLIEKPNTKTCSFSEFRNWAIICYLLGTGNRLKTLCNVRIEDIDFYNDEIRLTQVKNKKPHIIPLSIALKKVLQEYLIHRKGNLDDYLFITQYGKQMAKDSVTSAITKYNKKRGVSKTSIHLFRNTFAKSWIMNGGDIFRLQKILGHSSLDMVRVYVEIFGGDLKKDFTSRNPLDKHFNSATTIRMNNRQ